MLTFSVLGTNCKIEGTEVYPEVEVEVTEDEEDIVTKGTKSKSKSKKEEKELPPPEPIIVYDEHSMLVMDLKNNSKGPYDLPMLDSKGDDECKLGIRGLDVNTLVEIEGLENKKFRVVIKEIM